MGKYKHLITMFFVCFVNAAYAKNSIQSCEEAVTKLTVNKKHDFNLMSKSCDFEENPFIENFLINGKQKRFVNKYSMDGGKWPQKLEAVSIYKQKNKVPVLITLHTQRWDTPTINGVTYSINLYKIINNNEGVNLIDISKILGEDKSGLDGVSDDYMHFKFKDINSIKEWLDKNYK
ncbi:hypothetical protein [Acinetobacter dispersus]|uniref:Peptidase M23 domain-containing protein n=1 Tax=Acinetobacter dispersus TaxID=70348 RepID=N9LD47_9GAMM|nr:hypothetical protein [Acinetobacter dispersus]ENW94197.1 hypothetical protein F904_01113 [Acinetobacter dispersus]